MAVNQTGDDYEVYSVIKDNKNARSELTNVRSKSTRPGKGYSESEVKYKRKNIQGTTVESLGFTKDFLDFDTKSPALLISNKNDEMDVSKRYENVDFSKLQDLDFTTNRPDAQVMHNLIAKANNLNIIDEVNEKDYETPKYPGGDIEKARIRPVQQKEESLLDL